MTVVDKSRPTSHDIRQCWLGVQDPDKKDVPFLWLTTSAILVWKVIPKNRRRYLERTRSKVCRGRHPADVGRHSRARLWARFNVARAACEH
jgi:hypothetical protein